MRAVAVARFSAGSAAQRIWTRPRRKRAAVMGAQVAAGPAASQRRRASLRLEPPASDIELDRVEGLGPYPLAAAVGARDDPPIALEAIDLERAGEGIDDPEMRDPLAPVDAHLAT